MITIEKKANCCGCNVCGDACPKGAISFQADNEGFLYPHVEKSLCIDCGICEKVCPVIHIDSLKQNDKDRPDCYAAMHKSMEVIFASTTGGMFSAIADVMYRQHGYVGGAIHNEDMSVSQFISNDRHDLIKLRRSKDLQSNAEGFYCKVKTLLNNGEKVLVCGVPCQMAGLRAYLGKEYENLLIVDLICLGVNSPKVWRKYIDSIEEKYGSKVIYTENKSKEYGWRNLTQKFVFENGEEAFETKDVSLFTKGFVETHLYCRPSCYECKFKGFPRIADITIGDFWGIEKFDTSMDKNIGTSLVMVNSQKGERFFEKVKKRINFLETPFEWALPGNPALQYPITKSSINREDFFSDLDSMPFDDVVTKYSAHSNGGIKFRVKNKLRPLWNHLKFLKQIIKVTRLHPKALYQTIKYSGLSRLLKHQGLLCGTYCNLSISPKCTLELNGLMILGAKDRFPASTLETRLLVADGGKLIVNGEMVIGYGSDIEVFENAKLTFEGKRFGLSDTNIGCTIICGKEIYIGADVAMGRNVLIRDNNGEHYMNTPGYRTARSVIIGEKAWLCESCTIMPGVKIGRGAIVGAKAMVTASVPAHALVSGSPAEVIAENVLWKV